MTQDKFQFPSNGKVETKKDWTIGSFMAIKFQFPSNGKVEPKIRLVCFCIPNTIYKVSIPFKRESGAKVDLTGYHVLLLIASCFNSLQTGKWSQRYT